MVSTQKKILRYVTIRYDTIEVETGLKACFPLQPNRIERIALLAEH